VTVMLAIYDDGNCFLTDDPIYSESLGARTLDIKDVSSELDYCNKRVEQLWEAFHAARHDSSINVDGLLNRGDELREAIAAATEWSRRLRMMRSEIEA
jgi:hypothetical protein